MGVNLAGVLGGLSALDRDLAARARGRRDAATQQSALDAALAKQQREEEASAVEAALKRAQADKATVETNALRNPAPPKVTIIGEVTDPDTGEVYNRYSDGTAAAVRMQGQPSAIDRLRASRAPVTGHENDDEIHGQGPPPEASVPAAQSTLRVGVKKKDPVLREVGGDLWDVTDPKKPVLVQKAPAKGPSDAQVAAGESRRGQREDRLQQNFQQDPAVKQAGVIANAVAQLRASASQKTPQGDLSMIYGVVKLRDPNSAVREGEIDLQRAARSLGTRITAAWNKALSGHVLTDQERADILKYVEQTVDEQTKLVEPVQKRFGHEARQVGADSAFVAPDPLAGVRAASTNSGRTETGGHVPILDPAAWLKARRGGTP